jgi:DNA-binding transcriptional LysR family regulator
LELGQLKAFVAVAEERNVGRAAARLHLTPSPVSRAVRELERHLGTTLLLRLHHDIELTEAGRHLLAGAQEILQQLNRLEITVREIGAAKPPSVAVGGTHYAAPSLVDRVVVTIKENAPEYAVSLVTDASSALIPAVREGRMDVALVHLPVSDADLDSLPLGVHEFDVAMRAGHALAERTELWVADLAGVEILLTSAKLQPLAMKRLQAALESKGSGPVRFVENRDFVQIAADVLRSNKVTLSFSEPDSALSAIFSTAQYVRVPLRSNEISMQIGLIWRRTTNMPAWLEATIAELSS